MKERKKLMAEKMSTKKLNDLLREHFLGIVTETFEQLDEEVLVVNSNELSIPCLDSAGNEKFVNIIVKVPTGARGEDYDGYEMAEDYKFKLEEKQKKAEEKEKKKQEKIEKDKKLREEKKRLKELEKINRMK